MALKILLISNKVPYPANDGSSIAIKSMVEGMLYQGAEVHMLSINTSRHYKDPATTQKALPENLHFYSVDANTDLHWKTALQNLMTTEAYQVSRFMVEDFREKLRDLLQKHSFDVVQIEGLPMAVYIDDIRQHSEARISYRAHNVEYLIWERQLNSEPNTFKRIYLREQLRRLKTFETKVLGQIDLLIPITKIDESQLLKMGFKGRSMTVPCGLYLQSIQPKEAAEQTDIAYIASFDWLPNRNGMEWFVKQVWPIIQMRKAGSRMKLAGRHMPAEWTEFYNKGILVEGEVGSAIEFIQSAKVVIIPLLAGSGMRIKLIEYLALGKAIVSTSIGAEGVEIENEKSILLADKPEDFAAAVVRLLEDEKLRSELEKNSRMAAEEHYDNRTLGKELLKFYSQSI